MAFFVPFFLFIAIQKQRVDIQIMIVHNTQSIMNIHYVNLNQVLKITREKVGFFNSFKNTIKCGLLLVNLHL